MGGYRRQVERQAFFAELEKVASINRGDVRRGVNVVHDVDAFVDSLKKGDIIVTKHTVPTGLFNKAIIAATRSPWTHTGIYNGDGKILHYYVPIKRDVGLTGLLTGHKLREHKLTSLAALGAGRDMLALRPKRLTDEELAAGVERIKTFRKVPYSFGTVFRAGFAPSSGPAPENPTRASCVSATALAHPQVDLVQGRSPQHARASDFVKSKNVNHVIAFSPEE